MKAVLQMLRLGQCLKLAAGVFAYGPEPTGKPGAFPNYDMMNDTGYSRLVGSGRYRHHGTDGAKIVRLSYDPEGRGWHVRLPVRAWACQVLEE